MQEFEFTIRFEEGADPLMDIFREHHSLSARSSWCFVTESSMWRIDQITGSTEALQRLDAQYLDRSRCNECLDAPDCQTHREYYVLDSTQTTRTIYTYRTEIRGCHSIPYVVVDHVGDGCVFEARRIDDEYRWRVLYPSEQAVGELYDAIEGSLRSGLSLDLSRLQSSVGWDATARAAAQLSVGHWEALETAFERGYYDRPREVTVEDIADALGTPSSTVQYRLRTAEDLIMSTFMEDSI